MREEAVNTKKLGNKGFSLIELIIVIAIMAILIGIVGTQVVPYIEKSKQAKDKQVLSGLLTNATTAFADNASVLDDTATYTFKVGDAPTGSDAAKTKVMEEFYELAGITKTAGTGGTASYQLKSVTDKMSSKAGKSITEIKVERDTDGKVTVTTTADSKYGNVFDELSST